ncbi:fasciclin domain-containing protein [Agriterribacter sp.]|uniref:fasciclin domain-containing protein n=1 Tax=Agriterribacter sp. TaxID=2821509 RepID=UPI002CB426DF|nr:fasciclin domain-containing protein [Agriterribacter sp.]HRO46839.1 fasciclin domain-containing protein [Agriterribacter sp.]HRQ18052.1 fasciclin domain-containing protein [Agriterribacter sp.]
MKFIKIIGIVAVLFTSGCSRDYFADGGTLNMEETSVLGVSTMDYLKSRPEVFDTLTALITLSGLEPVVNASGSTFLAPQNYSIRNYFNLVFPDPEKRPATFGDIPQDEMDKITEILKNYIIPDQEIVRAGLATTYSYATTYGDKKARFNLVQGDYLGNVNMGAKYIIFSLNMSEPGQKEQYQSVQIISSDLRSTNGIVQVLNADTHIFGFN